MMPRYFRQSRGPKQGRGNPSQSAAVIWYAPAAPFDVMWLECGDEGNELMTDDQGWDTSRKGGLTWGEASRGARLSALQAAALLCE